MRIPASGIVVDVDEEEAGTIDVKLESAKEEDVNALKSKDAGAAAATAAVFSVLSVAEPAADAAEDVEEMKTPEVGENSM